jgi:pimeloyl-ACP methyl ester carboxylesterase
MSAAFFSDNRSGFEAEHWPVGSQELTRATLTVAGHQMSYVTGGHGPPLVLVHGLGTSSYTWRFVLPDLMRHFTIYAPDMLGSGESDKAGIDLHLDALAGYLQGFLEGVGLERASFIGHSMGGGIVMTWSYLFPGHLDRLILLNSGGLGREMHWLLRISTLPVADSVIGMLTDPRLGVAQMSRAMEQRRMRRLSQELDPATPTMLDRFRAPETRAAFLSMLRGIADLRGQRISALPLLPEMEHPTLIIWGARDRTLPVTHAYQAMQMLPNARLEVIPNCFHRPQLEAVDRFIPLALEFLLAETPMHAIAPETNYTRLLRRKRVMSMAGKVAPVALAAVMAPTGLGMLRRSRRRRSLLS